MKELFKNEKTTIGINGDYLYLSHLTENNQKIALNISIEEFIKRIGNFQNEKPVIVTIDFEEEYIKMNNLTKQSN